MNAHVLYQGMASAMPKIAAKEIRASAPAFLVLCQIAIAIGILRGRIGQSCFYRVLSNVFAVLKEALLIIGPHFGKPRLPDLSQILKFPLQAVGESALDELHCFLNGYVFVNRKEKMHVIGHNHEIVQLEFTLRNTGPQYINEKHCITFGLQ